MPRQQRQQRWHEDHKPDSAQTLRHWGLDLPRNKPAQPEQRGKDGQQKSSDPEELQRKVRDKRSDHADPVAGNMSASQHRGAIQRRIERRVRSQREEEEERRDAQQETDQLIQPPVARGNKYACQKTHVGRFSPGRKMIPWRNRPEHNHYYKKRPPAAMGE